MSVHDSDKTSKRLNELAKAVGARPAFPSREGTLGMTLWQHYFGVALQGFLAAYSGLDCVLPLADRAASDCAAYADAMCLEIARRELEGQS